ncbi:MAG: hypothetical protein ACE5MB_08305 [Anaerolineae bacterium]
MNTKSRFVVRHAVASVGSLIALMFLWILVYTLSGSTTEFMEPPANFFWCCRTIMWLAGVLFPVSVVAESLLVGRPTWRWWAHIPAMAVMFFVVSIVIVEIGTRVLFGQWVNQPAGLILGLEDSLWGVAYWSLLRASNTLLNIVLGKSEVTGKPPDFG